MQNNKNLTGSISPKKILNLLLTFYINAVKCNRTTF
jgi:hypothetical protein